MSSRRARPPTVILALSGGTGGSKMVDGLAQVHGQPGLAVVVNTGDDADFYGLRVCPDLDICTYVLAGVVDERGWGYAGDTFRCLEGLATYGREAWFGLGDRDLATHLHRTLRLAEGAGLSPGDGRDLRAAGGRGARAADDRRPGAHAHHHRRRAARSFQEYLVRDGAADEIERIELVGRRGRPAGPGLLEAIAAGRADRDLPLEPGGLDRDDPGGARACGPRSPAGAPTAWRSARSSAGARSRARPTASCAGAGYAECSATQMARIYADVAAIFVLDATDAAEAPAIAELGVAPVLDRRPHADRPARARLAAVALEAAA